MMNVSLQVNFIIKKSLSCNDFNMFRGRTLKIKHEKWDGSLFDPKEYSNFKIFDNSLFGEVQLNGSFLIDSYALNESDNLI